MKPKIAIPLEGVPSVVLLDNGERMSRSRALTAGYRIVDAAAVKSAEVADVAVDAIASWRLGIECLPEARERTSAVAELIANRNPETLSVEAARAFLRGLPVESEHTEETNMTTDTDPRAARLAEIANTMSAVNRNNGYKSAKAAGPSLNDIEPAKLKRFAEIRYSSLYASGRGTTQEAKTIRLALDTHNRVGTPISQAFAQLDFDVSTLLPKTI